LQGPQVDEAIDGGVDISDSLTITDFGSLNMNEAVRNFYNNFAERLIFQKEINHARYQFVGKIAASLLKPRTRCWT
jgi:hypothetical protein